MGLWLPDEQSLTHLWEFTLGGSAVLLWCSPRGSPALPCTPNFPKPAQHPPAGQVWWFNPCRVIPGGWSRGNVGNPAALLPSHQASPAIPAAAAGSDAAAESVCRMMKRRGALMRFQIKPAFPLACLLWINPNCWQGRSAGKEKRP